MSAMRAKMTVQSVTIGTASESVKFVAVSAKFGPNGESEDNTYALYTPFGELNIQITNPALLGKFKPGQKFYLDFTESVE